MFPRPHDIIYVRSLRGVGVPAPPEEFEHLDGEAHLRSVRREQRPIPFGNLTRDFGVPQSFERSLPGENLDSQHRKSKNIGRFRLKDCDRRVDDLWSEPPHVPSGGLVRNKPDARVDERESIICESNVAQLVDKDIRLRG
jgi:hypothetical protein